MVIVTWEQILRPPFYAWVDRNYPGVENVEERWKIQQRAEHFFISLTVDVVVVSILLAIVGRQQRRLAETQEQLAHNEKIAALGRVGAQVAHEVKNPLAGLLLYSMHLKSKVATHLPESEAVLIDKIIDTINHLTRTVEQVMKFASPVQLTQCLSVTAGIVIAIGNVHANDCLVKTCLLRFRLFHHVSPRPSCDTRGNIDHSIKNYPADIDLAVFVRRRLKGEGFNRNS